MGMMVRNATLSVFCSKTPASAWYSNTPTSWERTLSSFVDEGTAALCVRQWLRASFPTAQPRRLNVSRRRPAG